MVSTRDYLNITGGLCAGGLIALLGFATWALIFVEVPDKNQNALLILIGILSTNVGQVVSFFFGSSSTDKKSSETISTLASTNASAQAALPTTPVNIPLAPGDKVVVQADVLSTNQP